jgi:hypothetical protein
MAIGYHRIKSILFTFGLLLLGINVVGLFVSLRNPAIYQEKKVRDERDITLTAEELLQAAERKPGEPRPVYVTRLNDAVNKGIAYYWEDEGIEKYELRVPIYENYLLYLAGYVSPRYRKYEFSDQYKNIERGVGLCSLHATVIAALLKDHGVDSKVVLLDQHVVAMAQVDETRDRWWIVDSTLGVVVKHDIAEIERDPDLIKPYYLERGYSREYVEWLARVYGREGNVVFNEARDYMPWRLRFIEYISYIFKWVIPMTLIVPFVLACYRNRNRPASISPRASDQPDFTLSPPAVSADQ